MGADDEPTRLFEVFWIEGGANQVLEVELGRSVSFEEHLSSLLSLRIDTPLEVDEQAVEQALETHPRYRESD